MRYEIFVTVWGKRFVRKFVEFALASQLAPGNIPALSAVADVTYRIYTDRASENYFQPEITKLKKLAIVEFVFYEDLAYRSVTLMDAINNSDPTIIKHNVQRETARHHMNLAKESSETAIMLLDSDFIFSDGSFAHIHEQRVNGKKAYAGMFVRLIEEKAIPILRSLLPKPLSARELVQIGMDNMHPLPRSMFIDAKKPSMYPTQINWNVNDNGFVANCFFPHPLMFEQRPEIINYFSTMDYEVLLRAVTVNDDLYYCQSSEDLMFCKISPESYFGSMEAGSPPSIDVMARFVIFNTNIRHRLFMGNPVRYLAREDEKAFRAVEREARSYTEAIYKNAELLLAEFSPLDPKMTLYAKSFLGPIENFISPQIHSRMKDILPK